MADAKDILINYRCDIREGDGRCKNLAKYVADWKNIRGGEQRYCCSNPVHIIKAIAKKESGNIIHAEMLYPVQNSGNIWGEWHVYHEAVRRIKDVELSDNDFAGNLEDKVETPVEEFPLSPIEIDELDSLLALDKKEPPKETKLSDLETKVKTCQYDKDGEQCNNVARYIFTWYNTYSVIEYRLGISKHRRNINVPTANSLTCGHPLHLVYLLDNKKTILEISKEHADKKPVYTHRMELTSINRGEKAPTIKVIMQMKARLGEKLPLLK